MAHLETQIHTNNGLISQLCGTVAGLTAKLDQFYDAIVPPRSHRLNHHQGTPTPGTPSYWRSDYTGREPQSD